MKQQANRQSGWTTPAPARGTPMSETTLPCAHGTAVLTAAIRTMPEDFFVEEIDAFAPSGEGEHLLLDVEKRGMNTAFAAKLIAQ